MKKQTVQQRQEHIKPNPSQLRQKQAYARQNLTLPYSIILMLFWGNYAVIASYVSMFLLDRGFNNTQVGVVVALSSVLAAFLQPALGTLSDRSERFSVRAVLLFLDLVFLAFMLGTYLFYGVLPVLSGISFGMGQMLMQVLTPFTIALASVAMNQGIRLNFGLARGIGSGTYALVALAAGVLVEKKGVRAIPPMAFLIMLLLAAAVYFYPGGTEKQKEQAEKEHPGKHPDAGDGIVSFLRRYKSFAVVLLGTIFIYTSHMLFNSYAFQLVRSKGGGSREMGIMLAIAAVCEIPPMFVFSGLVKRIQARVWLMISGIFFFVKALILLLAPNMAVLYAAQFLQMPAYALLTVSSVYYINDIMDPGDSVKGQAYFTMTTTIGTVLCLVGGWLIDQGGVNAMLLFSTAAAGAGAFVMTIGLNMRRTRGKQGQE